LTGGSFPSLPTPPVTPAAWGIYPMLLPKRLSIVNVDRYWTSWVRVLFQSTPPVTPAAWGIYPMLLHQTHPL